MVLILFSPNLIPLQKIPWRACLDPVIFAIALQGRMKQTLNPAFLVVKKIYGSLGNIKAAIFRCSSK